MNIYAEKWAKLTFHGFNQEEYRKKIGSWRKGATQVCDIVSQGKNCGVVADTAAGKTIIAILSAVALGKRTLFLAPQRLLDEQHNELVGKIDGTSIQTRFIHGKVSRKKRIWNDPSESIVFATPQVVVKDKSFNIRDFELVIFDEMHRATGRYPYVQLAREAHENGLAIIGLSASPGGSLERIERLKRNLFLNKYVRIEVETPPKGESILIAEVDENLRAIEEIFLELIGEVAEKIRAQGVEFDPTNTTMKGFEKIEEFLKAIDLFKGAYLAAKYRKLRHAYLTAMIDGYDPLLKYLTKVKETDSSKSGREIVYDRRVWKVARIAKDSLHPKVELLFKVLSSMKNFKRTTLVFIGQKTTANGFAERCEEMGLRAGLLFGGSDKSIPKQKKMLEKLACKELDLVFATSVAEEGLSVPEIDAVIHYAMPLTEISLIQRSGRTGRMKYGNVIFIALNHPFDNSMYYASRGKARKMRKLLRSEIAGETSQENVLIPNGPHMTLEFGRPIYHLKKKGKRWVDVWTPSLFGE